MSQKKKEGIPFSAEIRVVGSSTDRLLSFPKSSFGPSRQIAAQFFFKKHYEPNKFDFC